MWVAAIGELVHELEEEEVQVFFGVGLPSTRTRMLTPAQLPFSACVSRHSRLHDERVAAVREELNCHFEVYQYSVTERLRSSQTTLLTWCRRFSGRGPRVSRCISRAKATLELQRCIRVDGVEVKVLCMCNSFVTRNDQEPTKQCVILSGQDRCWQIQSVWWMNTRIVSRTSFRHLGHIGSDLLKVHNTMAFSQKHVTRNHWEV